MLAEPQKNLVDECNKMQTLSSSQLPELIKSFELKANHQKDVTQVKSGRPAPKMKLRDAGEVLEIARLKVLVAEMREKTMRMEAQLKSAAEKCDKKESNPHNIVRDDRKDEKKITLDKISRNLMVDRKGDNVEMPLAKNKTQNSPHSFTEGARTEDATCDIVDVFAPSANHLHGTHDNLQSISKNVNKAFLVQQTAKLDKDRIELQAHVESLQCDVNQMLLEVNQRPDSQAELAAAKARIKGLQEEIRDDASLTKVQLLLLKQQFGKLEEIKKESECKELEFQRTLQTSSALEAEVAELKRGNQELLTQKHELAKKLGVLKKAEKTTPLTKDGVLASKAEVSKLRSTNVELQKKVEGLQMSRFNEVEEVVYLRWVNACLRHDLDIYKSFCRNSDDISNQIESCSPAFKDDPMLRTNSGRSSASYKDSLHYPALETDSKSMSEQYEHNIKSSPRLSNTVGHVNSRHLSPTSGRHGRTHINISPLAIPHGHVSSNHSSPQVSPLGRVDSSHSSLLSSPHNYLKSTQISPQNSFHGGAKTKSGALHSTQKSSPRNKYLSRSPDAYNPAQYSPGRALEKDPQKIAEIQSMLTYNRDRSAQLDASLYLTTHTSNPSRRSGRSFARSASTVSASSEGSIDRTQGSDQMQDRKTFARTSSTLSADSDTSSADQSMNAKSLRRHSASSGMSFLDEYLYSKDTKSRNRPTSRFSAVLPHDRQFSDLESVPFPTMKEVTEPFKREDSTRVKAYSFESHLDASDRVVVAFQRLSTSSQTNNTHRTFKDLSKQNSRDDKATSKVEQPDKHELHVTSTTRSAREEFICDLARAIQVTHYHSIEQVSAFVNWFDRQDDVEKQEFFKFPDCPKNKVEAMRRAVYEYEELQAMETDLNSSKDELKGPVDLALRDMKNLLETVENYIQGFKQARHLAIVQFSEFNIPTSWMLDSGIIAKIKQATLQLAQRYIKEVTKALDARAEPGVVSREKSLLEASKFLLQIHNFAGGFDEKTANAFKVLQSQAELKGGAVYLSDER